MNFQYSPGILGYGAKGQDGSAGIDGLALYFTDYDPIANILNIESAIANDEVLWSSAPAGTKLPGGRKYQNGDLFVDSRGFIYEINADIDEYDRAPGALNKSQFFQSKWNVISDTGFQRFHNILDGSPNILIDNTNSQYGSPNYTDPPKYLYGIESKNFARFEYSDIKDGSYNAFTVYSLAANVGSDDHKSLALVYDEEQKLWRLGNIGSFDGMRNTNLILDVSSITFPNSDIILNSPEGTILTNKQKNTPLLFDPNFQREPISFYATSPLNSQINIYWNLLDFCNDPSIKGVLHFNRRRDSSVFYMNASTGNIAVPMSFFDVEQTGYVQISNCPSAKTYEYQMVISKDGWERSSTIRQITTTDSPPIMTILDPSSKTLSADASGWFSSGLTYKYPVDISTNSPTGWNSSVIPPQTWVSLLQNSSSGPGLGTFEVSLGYNDTINTRSAVVYVFSEANPDPSILVTQTGQTAYTVYFNNDGSLVFSPALTNQTVTVGLKVYAWVRVQRDYALGSRTVRATINLTENGITRATATLSRTARNETIDASTSTSYNATGITASTQNKWRVDWTQLECEYDNSGDYEFSQVWAEITSVTKTSPSPGGGVFSVGTNKYWYAKKPITACNITESAASSVPAMPPFV